jgi:hypothetical protein
VVATIIYFGLQLLIYITQDAQEPRITERNLPFLDGIFGIFKHRATYFYNLGYAAEIRSKKHTYTHRSTFNLPIQTLRMPFQRLYVIHAPHLIHAIQSKANARTFVPNLLDFGMLFSGLNKESQATLRKAFGSHGNGFTMAVHKYLSSGDSLKIATQAAIDRLRGGLSNRVDKLKGGLQEIVRHELTLAMTGAIYGPENPYDDPKVEESWK